MLKIPSERLGWGSKDAIAPATTPPSKTKNSCGIVTKQGVEISQLLNCAVKNVGINEIGIS